METTLGNIQDPDVLMNFARQLQFGPSELQDWGQKLFEQGQSIAQQRYNEAQGPSVAISILFKLSRRQVLDFGRYDEVINFWEGLSADKRDWLWTEKKEFWGYLGQVFEAYAQAGKTPEAEAFAQDFLDDPASPPEGLPAIGIPFARWLMLAGRSADSLELYQRMASISPTHPLCAEAWYWMALTAYQRGESDKVDKFAAHIRVAQGTQVGLLSELNLEAKAFLLLSNLRISSVDPQAVNYSTDILKEQLQVVSEDLRRLP